MSHNKYLIHFIPNKKLNSYELENLLSSINSIYNICHIVNFTIEKQELEKLEIILYILICLLHISDQFYEI